MLSQYPNASPEEDEYSTHRGVGDVPSNSNSRANNSLGFPLADCNPSDGLKYSDDEACDGNDDIFAATIVILDCFCHVYC